MKDIDKNFKDNIDALKGLMEIVLSDDNDKYEKAKEWFIDEEYYTLYDYLLKHNLRNEKLQQDLYDTYIKDKGGNKKTNCKGCFTVKKSCVKVGNIEMQRNSTLHKRIADMFGEIFGDNKINIFFIAGNYVFRLEDDYNYDKVEDSTNCEQLKELMKEWEVGTPPLKKKMTFEGAIKIATVLKRLVPLNYDYFLDDGTHKIVYKQSDDLSRDYIVIDSHVFGYLLSKNNLNTKFDEWISRYIKLLVELKFEKIATTELICNLNHLMNRNKSLYALTAIHLYEMLEDINSAILDDMKFYRSINCDELNGNEMITEIVEKSLLDDELKKQIIEYIEKQEEKKYKK